MYYRSTSILSLQWCTLHSTTS